MRREWRRERVCVRSEGVEGEGEGGRRLWRRRPVERREGEGRKRERGERESEQGDGGGGGE